jgi:hypothetical protein
MQITSPRPSNDSHGALILTDPSWIPEMKKQIQGTSGTRSGHWTRCLYWYIHQVIGAYIPPLVGTAWTRSGHWTRCLYWYIHQVIGAYIPPLVGTAWTRSGHTLGAGQGHRLLGNGLFVPLAKVYLDAPGQTVDAGTRPNRHRLIPEGRESDTHSESPNFEKTGREPNRFEIVFFFATSRRHLKAM